MISKLAVVPFLLLLCSCATVNPNSNQRAAGLVPAPSQPRLLVGHGNHGEVVMAASHYDAMNGLAVAARDLGAPSTDAGDVFCIREVPTGSHVPHWICRYQDAIERQREMTRNEMEEARINLMAPAASVVVVSAGAAPGGAGRTGSPLPH